MPALLALFQCVEADVQHPGDQFQPGIRFAVLARTRISGDGFGGFAGRLAVRVELETQRRAETFFRFAAGQAGGIRFAADDQAEDALAATHAFVRQHFLVDPARSGRRG
ncbi:MAG TPA: hypothetical protein VF284_00935 [Rhodanobacteraceae bacterium]